MQPHAPTHRILPQPQARWYSAPINPHDPRWMLLATGVESVNTTPAMPGCATDEMQKPLLPDWDEAAQPVPDDCADQRIHW